MIFTDKPVAETEGAILAHGVSTAGLRFKKGRLISAEDVSALQEAGVAAISVAIIEADDIGEDAAAAELAGTLANDHIATTKAFTGRCNLIAEADGVLQYDPEHLHRLNLVDEAITLALLPPWSRVHKGQMIATVKIIPFAVPAALLQRSLELAEGLMTYSPFTPRQIGLLETTLDGTTKAASDKLARVTTDRLSALGSKLSWHHQTRHEVEELAQGILAHAKGLDLLLIASASATTDRRDVVPRAIEAAGGTVDHVGMPVDPGNLLVLGHVNDTAIIGLPGCARSPKLNGFDWVLERLAAGIDIGREDIMRMGAGGLLKEIGSRPQPRRQATTGKSMPGPDKNIAAIVLAAGASSRMGDTNKLLVPVKGKPMVRHSLEHVSKSGAKPLIVVTGRDADLVSEAARGIDYTQVHNPDYMTGMASSLKAGIDALPDHIDGALICLGDMPLVSSDQLVTLINQFDLEEGRGICVPTWQGKWGNPVLWAATYFDEIRAISGDKGARDLLHQHADRVHEVSMENEAVLRDFDTPDSLRTLDTD